ncbi:MAG TPA: hypothetical protein VGB09_12360 [Candidatus Binatia bacterium]
MNPWTAMLTGASVGAAAMYYLDPDLGARRRALVRYQVERLPQSWQDAASVTARDLKNRTVGFASEARARLTERTVDDEVLLGRVRSKLGFLVRHPSAIEVGVEDGRATLRGRLLSDEVEQLINGVRDVDNRLDVHTEPGNIPALQGDKPKPTGQPLDIMQRHWSPATRFLIAAAGALLLYSVNRQAKTAIFPGSLLLGITASRWGDGDGARSPRRRGPARAGGAPEPAGGWTS